MAGEGARVGKTEQWDGLSSEDLSMGETGRRLREKQWAEIRNVELRSETWRVAEEMEGRVECRDEQREELDDGAN